MDTSGLITIRDIVDSYLPQSKKDESDYLTYMMLVERAVLDLQLFISDEKKTTKITIDRTTLTADFPPDLVHISVLGFVENERLIPLAINNTLQINRDMSCGELVSQATQVDELMFYNNGAHYYGEFRVNHASRKFEFSSDIAFDELILEYVSTGINITGETLIPSNYREYLIADLNERSLKFDRSVSDSEKARAKMYRDEEYKKLKQMKVDITQLLDSWRKVKYQK